jgi:hypothetical protein
MKKLCYLMFVFLLFSSCSKMVMSVDKKQDFKIKDNLLILTHDNLAARDFIISLKNYLALNIEGHKIKVTKHNIVEGEKYDANMPDLKYVMDVTLDEVETEFNNQILLRGKFVINILDYKTKEIVWTSEVRTKRIFDSDKISTAKKIAKKIVENLDKDLIFN